MHKDKKIEENISYECAKRRKRKQPFWKFELKFAFRLEPTICYCGSREGKGFFNQSKSRFIVFGGDFHHCRKEEKEDRRKRKKKISPELQSKEIEDVINGIESDEDLGDHGGIGSLGVCFFFLIPFDLFRPCRKKKCETNLKKYAT
ncbi:hypothetical protein CEXT_292761 [Caerostris extrusa]|uniref:Uncharacterized protein n=1 Tax=Caerostris extrusa TaxID=172846 RepID=A0AAV4YBZ1_CAEEX|nr:hypothetical protein CEXT_292761 [Caerostris extrusa]